MNFAESTDPLKSSSDELKPRHVPLHELLDIKLVSAEAGRSKFEMRVEEKHLRTLGILHGGMTATLLDTALGKAAGSLAPAGHHVVTVQLNVNFIRPAWKGETLFATGEVVHSGKQTAVARGELRTAEDRLVGAATGTFMYLPRPADDGATLKKRDD